MTYFNTGNTFDIGPFITRKPHIQFDYSNCILCGKPVKVNTPKVHAVNGDITAIARTDETNIHEAGDMGWWSIGPDCANRLPDEYVARNK